MAKKTILTVDRKGTARGIVSPLVEKVMSTLGTPEIERASNVEPTPELSVEAVLWLARDAPHKKRPTAFEEADIPRTAILSALRLREMLPSATWWADLLRQEGGVVLGPFGTRQEALDAEEVWLRERRIPICRPCRATGS